jgi:hypothetical protein
MGYLSIAAMKNPAFDVYMLPHPYLIHQLSKAILDQHTYYFPVAFKLTER